jgi:hypothetical protein
MLNIISPAFITFPILIPSLLLQSSPRWRLYIGHDGPNKDFEELIPQDPRIIATCFQHRGNFGHHIRKDLINNLEDNGEYVVHQNHDNYLLPNFVAAIEQHTEDIVIWNCIHNYFGYKQLNSRIEYGQIDMGCIAIKSHIAKKVGWKSMLQDSDWLYIQEAWKESKTHRWLPQNIFVHN